MREVSSPTPGACEGSRGDSAILSIGTGPPSFSVWSVVTPMSGCVGTGFFSKSFHFLSTWAKRSPASPTVSDAPRTSCPPGLSTAWKSCISFRWSSGSR